MLAGKYRRAPSHFGDRPGTAGDAVVLPEFHRGVRPGITPRDQTPQDTILTPSTMYGVTKVAGELLCDYYFKRYQVDVRGLRYPGIISSETLPGGGTTDYAVDIFYKAITDKKYTCFLAAPTTLPMMYMPDAIKATIDLMEADPKTLLHPTNYNLAAMSFSAEQLAAEIRKHIPELVVDYVPDFRQAIADSWPRSIDDSPDRLEWNWQPAFDLPAMTVDFIGETARAARTGEAVSLRAGRRSPTVGRN